MKHIVIFIVFLLFIFRPVYAHKEWVHQFCLKQAYALLESKIGEVKPLKEGVGLNHHGPGNTGYSMYLHHSPIGIGVWREDLEDPVYNYNAANSGTSSVTHFWNADAGDFALTAIFPFGNRENAWQKAQRYLSATIPLTLDGQVLWSPSQMALSISLSYTSIIELYKGNYNITSWRNSINQIVPYNGTNPYLDHKRIALHMLGRIAHLLQDMSVPAHTHNHLHPCPADFPDYYENEMGGVWPNNLLSCESDPGGTYPAHFYSWFSGNGAGDLLDNIYSMNDNSALRYLFYTQNQIADFFPSGVNSNSNTFQTFVSGNNLTPYGTNSHINQVYSSLGYTPPQTINVSQIATHNFNLAIRTTATLLHWFAIRTGMLLPPKPILSKTGTIHLCEGGKILSVTNPVSSLIPTTYTWTPSGGALVNLEFTPQLGVTMAIDGWNGTVSVTASNKYGTSAATEFNTNIDAPSFTLTPEVPEVLCIDTGFYIDNPDPNTQYFWEALSPNVYFWAGYVYGSTPFENNWMTVYGDGSFKVTAVNECGSVYKIYTISCDNPDVMMKLTTYPNPVNDQMTIESTVANDNEEILVEIYDNNGNLKKKIKAKGPKFVVVTSDLPADVYFLHIKIGKDVIMKRMVVSR